MQTQIHKRLLTNNEIDLIIEEIRKFPNPLTTKKAWQNLKKVYIAVNNKNLVGVCGVTKLKNWVKIGPFVVFEKYHNKGFGKIIFSTLLSDYESNNLYIGSRNRSVAKIATRFRFKEEKNIWNLPSDIRHYLFRHILENLSIEYLKELIRKRPYKEGPFRHFLRQQLSSK